MNPEIRKCLVGSTGHVTLNVAHLLSDISRGQHDGLITPLCVMEYPEGWIIRWWTSPEYGRDGAGWDGCAAEWRKTPVCIKRLIEKAESLECDMIQLDRDADTIEGMKTWEW